MAGETIVFGALADSPDTQGTAALALPLLQILANETPNVGVMTLPRLTIVSAGTVLDYASGIFSLPPLEIYAFDAPPGFTFNHTDGWGVAKLPAFEMDGATAAGIVPMDAVAVLSMPPLQIVASGGGSVWGTAVLEMPRFATFSYEAAGDFAVLDLPPLRIVSMQTLTVPSTRASLMVQPVMYGLASNTWVLSDVVTFSDDLINDLILALQSNAAFTDQYTLLGKLLMSLESDVYLRTTFRFVLEAALNDNVEFTDTSEITIDAIMALVDSLMVTDEFEVPWLSAVITITSALVLADKITHGLDIRLESVADFADIIEQHQTLIASLVSEVVLADEISGQMMMAMALNSDAMFDDAEGFDTLISALMSLSDDAMFSVRFTTPGGDSYAGYMLNVRNAAVSEWTNFNFNSFANVGKLVLAASYDGIYVLGGNTDQDAPIPASVYTGLMDFGTSQLKRSPNAYVGYTSDGRLRLVVLNTDGGGKKENWYTLKPRTANSPVDGRFSPAKGLVARYWGYRIENVEGSDFALDSLKVWPMFLQRRKSGR